jgi:peptidoglycan hydrolase-like protein with peptidoglycan-binding domain
MQTSMLTKAGAAALILLAAGCADMRAPTGNQTSYATGSYRMPPKAAQVAQAPAQVQANSAATAPDSRTRTSAPIDTSKVQAAQQALARAGYNPGNATGDFDAPTHDAVAQFQRARGLKATGDLDSSTMSALGLPTQ